jgi:hypothetical protein
VVSFWCWLKNALRSQQLTYYSIFPALDRRNFEGRLRAYFRDPKHPEIAWVALLAAVFACGCRALLSAETPSAFEHSGAESWAYYQTAIDLVSQLLYKPTDILVVEVILLCFKVIITDLNM